VCLNSRPFISGYWRYFWILALFLDIGAMDKTEELRLGASSFPSDAEGLVRISIRLESGEELSLQRSPAEKVTILSIARSTDDLDLERVPQIRESLLRLTAESRFGPRWAGSLDPDSRLVLSSAVPDDVFREKDRFESLCESLVLAQNELFVAPVTTGTNANSEPQESNLKTTPWMQI
jgi:hypothetical protein